MKKFILIFSLLFSFLSYSFSRDEILKTLDQMKSSGKFSPAEIEMAKIQLMSMNKKQIENLNKKALEKSQDPKYIKKAQEALNNLQQ